VEGGAAVFALPNAIHRARCEPLREEVETALAAHFKMAVPIRLVVDPGAVAAAAGPEPDPVPEPEPEEAIIDVSELRDAPPAVTSGIDHLTEAFPGAELVEE
jgi:hypothetical protein